MNNSGNKFGEIKSLLSSNSSAPASVTESEDAIRNLKASQSVEAAFLAVGMPNPPGDVAAIITNQVKSAIKNLPLDQVRNMTPGSGPLGTALAAVDQYVGMLSPSQRRAAEQSTNTLSPSEMLKLHALMGRSDTRNGGGEPNSSRRYDGINQAFTETQKQALDLARKVGLDWVANNPDLLRLGPSAIQALADVHLRQDSYKRLKGDVGLDDKTVVDGARYFKRTGGDYNQFSEDAATVSKGLTTSEQQEHRKAVGDVFRAKTPQQEQEARDKFNATTDRFVKSHPALKPHIERERELLKQKQRQLIKSEVKADAKDAKAEIKDTKANDVAALKNNALGAFDALDSSAETAVQPKKQQASNRITVFNADKSKPKQVATAPKPKQPTPT